MKTIEELEARLETVNVERDDLKRRLLDMVLQRNDVRDKLDICALDLVTAKRERDAACDDLAFVLAEYANERNEELTEDALCLKIAGLTHQLEEARAIGGSCWLTYSEGERDKARAWAHQCERERDEARAEVERLSDASIHWQVMLKRETEEVYRLTNERDDARTQLSMTQAWHEQMCRSSEKGWAEVEMLRERVTEHQRKFEAGWSVLRKQRDEARAEVGMLEDRLSESRAEVDRLTDERDELLVRVEDQGAELRATREAYVDAYRRGVEAMRESWCRMRALPIPEEP